MSAATLSVADGSTFKRYLNALLEGDVRVINAIIDELLAGHMPMNTIYRDFVRRGMYEVGLLCENNQIQVSVEHLAASATQLALSELYLKHQRPQEHSPEVIIACVPNEMHDVGTMIVANLCESTGCKSVLLGANTPIKDLLVFIGQRKHMPDLLALSVTLPANRVALENALEEITARFPQLKIVIGGQALDIHREAILFKERLTYKFATVQYIPSLDALELYLRRLVKGKQDHSPE
jgi:MerR family transcriptional regulator, light-induced transcriptional regulator